MKKLEAALPEKEVSKAPAGGDTSRCGSLKPKTSKAEVNRKPSCPSPRATRVRLNLDAIIADDSVRTRRKTDDSIAEEYAEKMKTGVKFPPIVVFTDDKSYWLSDGFHRLQAVGVVPDAKKDADRGEKKAFKKHAEKWFKSVEGGEELAAKVFEFDLWPKIESQIMPFLNAVRGAVSLPEIAKLPP